jgi:hypothetical protein
MAPGMPSSVLPLKHLSLKLCHHPLSLRKEDKSSTKVGNMAAVIEQPIRAPVCHQTCRTWECSAQRNTNLSNFNMKDC